LRKVIKPGILVQKVRGLQVETVEVLKRVMCHQTENHYGQSVLTVKIVISG
jgi:hypothetical protein